MKDALLLIMSILGLFAIYWICFGQWKHNKMMMNAQIERLKVEQMKEKAESNKKK